MVKKNDNVSNVNLKKAVEQAKKIEAVREIIGNHKTHSNNKIQSFLVSEYDLDVSISTIKRLRKIIGKEKKVKAKIKREGTRKTDKPSERLPPYWVHCPLCGAGARITIQENQSVGCYRCGTTYDRKNAVWFDRDGWEITKEYKPPPRFKSLIDKYFSGSN